MINNPNNLRKKSSTDISSIRKGLLRAADQPSTKKLNNRTTSLYHRSKSPISPKKHISKQGKAAQATVSTVTGSQQLSSFQKTSQAQPKASIDSLTEMGFLFPTGPQNQKTDNNIRSYAFRKPKTLKKMKNQVPGSFSHQKRKQGEDFGCDVDEGSDGIGFGALMGRYSRGGKKFINQLNSQKKKELKEMGAGRPSLLDESFISIEESEYDSVVLEGKLVPGGELPKINEKSSQKEKSSSSSGEGDWAALLRPSMLGQSPQLNAITDQQFEEFDQKEEEKRKMADSENSLAFFDF